MAIPATMRQALIRAPNRFEVVAAPVPPSRGRGRDPPPHRPSCGICSGDLMTWYLEKKVGTVFGHEPAGWAVASARPSSTSGPATWFSSTITLPV